MTKYAGGDAVYALGLIGALVYFLKGITTIMGFLVGILKSLFWPAFLIHGLLRFLKV